MAKRKWIAPMMAKAKKRGTVGIFGRKAKSLGISTKSLARRWYGKAGVWGKRARAAAHMMALPRPSRTARARGGRKAARTRARRR
jgi:hypothetical protein